MGNAAQTFHTVDRICTGPGCLSAVAEAAVFGPDCLLVAGQSSMRASGVLARVIDYLRAAGVRVSLFEGVEQDPCVATVDAIRSRIRETAALFVVGLGGGSAMDAAKAAAGLAAHSEPTALFLHQQLPARPGIPVVAVATTSGTGAEVTPNAVISDPAARVKASLRNGCFLPAMAIVDPEITLPCPPRVTAHSGMDAITQAIESFVSIHASPLSDAFAFDAFRLLWSGLERAYSHGEDIAARSACSYGSLMAGIALANARLGAVHGIAHPLGVRYAIPHGLACAVLIPEVTKANLPSSPGKFDRLSRVAGTDVVAALVRLNQSLGIYDDFAAYKIPPDQFALVADESLPSGSMKANPRNFSRDDVIRVLQAVTTRAGGCP